MKNLRNVLHEIPFVLRQGTLDVNIQGITLDSREVQPDFAFIAVKGSASDGHHFISQAIAKGASVILGTSFEHFEPDVTYVELENRRSNALDLAANFYDHPSTKLRLIGVTGTNGKTSLVFLCHQMTTLMGYKSGLLSTIENRVGDQIIASKLTTPDPVTFQSLLHQMVASGCTHVFMEVSSHALHQHRVDPSMFDLAVFTNITHDHLDYHKTFDHYISAKKSFFDGLKPEADALVNIDDKRGAVMLQNCQAKQHTYGLYKAADFKGKILENAASGLHVAINQKEIYSPLVGVFNAYNLVAAYGVHQILFDGQENILEALSSVHPPPGRFEAIRDRARGITAIVDYAHTPDALKNVLETLLAIRKENEQIITVVGCGGDRDKAKRPVMAKVACYYSSKVILTSDNPRSEDPNQIILDMERGVPEDKRDIVLTIEHRAEAIRVACLMAPQNALILIAGKGHESYQEINGERKHFDDREHIRACFNWNQSSV